MIYRPHDKNHGRIKKKSSSLQNYKQARFNFIVNYKLQQLEGKQSSYFYIEPVMHIAMQQRL